MRGFAAAGAVLAVFGAFGGCLDSPANVPAVRVGDTATYAVNTGGTARLVVSGFAELELPHREPCVAVTLLLDDVAPPSPEGPDRTLSSEESICLDPSLETRSLRRSIHQYTGETQFELRYGTPDVKAVGVFCAVACRTPAFERIAFGGTTPIGAQETFQLERTKADRYVATWTYHEPPTRFESTMVVEYRFAEGAYPAQISLKTTRSAGGDVEMEWRLTATNQGHGAALVWRSAVSPARASEIVLAPWSDRPPEGQSPFRYAQEAALQQLSLAKEFLEFKQSHPSAFVAAASYSEQVDSESGQEELLWDFLWQQETAAFLARCHRLASPLPRPELSLTTYTEESCFDFNTFESPLQVSRVGLPTETLTWERAASLWRTVMGANQPIRGAHWTMFTSFTSPNPHGMDMANAATTDRIVMMFDYNVGELDSDPYSPTWIAQDPPWQQRVTPNSYSILDAATGRFILVTSPVEPTY